MDFLSSGNIILLFRALLKFLKFGSSNFFKRNLTEETSMETDFLASGSYLSSSGNVFLNEFFIPYSGNRFSAFGNRFLLFNLFFYN